MDQTEIEDGSRRGRANESLNMLHDALSRKPVATPGKTPPRRHQRANSWSERGSPGAHDYSYRSAASRLRDILHQTERGLPPSGVHFSPPRWSELPVDAAQTHDNQYRDLLRHQAEQPGELPRAEELYALVQQQGAYITQLELENKYCKDEMTALKSKIHELSTDNKRLHAELKRAICHDILAGNEGGEEEEVTVIPNQLANDPKFQKVKNSPEFISRSIMLQKWQKETDRISELHQSKNARLESQLKQAKDDLEIMVKENEKLKAAVRMAESVGRGSGNVLCAVCCKKEAILPSQQAALTNSVERLTREREELVESLASLKVKLDIMHQRESEAYDQVKTSIILVEEAQLEKTEALVQREQIGDELEKLRSRFEENIQDFQEKIEIERHVIRQEFQKEIDDANARLKELNESLAAAQHRLERSQREKLALQTEFDKTKSQLSVYESELGQTTNSMKYQLTKAHIDKEMAVQALQKLRIDLDKKDHDHDQERLKHKMEVDDLKRRLTAAERELMESKDECIYLTSNLQTLERDVHFAKISKECLERGRSDDFKLLHQRHQQRELELTNQVEHLQTRYDDVEKEYEEMFEKQNTLIHKLKDECLNLTKKLEQVSADKRTECKYLKSQIDELKHRLKKSKLRMQEIQKFESDHSQIYDKMKMQIADMDGTLQKNARQFRDLNLAKSEVEKNRDKLLREVEFLRHQMANVGTNV